MLANRRHQLSLEESRAFGVPQGSRWDKAAEAGPSMAALDTNKDGVRVGMLESIDDRCSSLQSGGQKAE
jgi:hypothetical protein